MFSEEQLSALADLVAERVMERLLEPLGAWAQTNAERLVAEKIEELRNGKTAVVADAVTLGSAVTKTRTGPNGTQTLAALWLGDEKGPGQATWVAVMAGVTVAENKTVVLQRLTPGSSSASWLIIGLL